MTAIYEIPLGATNQVVKVPILGITYNLRLVYNASQDENQCWIMDINDTNNNPIVCGIPLLPGVDLLGQYRYLGIGVVMWCYVDGNIDAVPAYGQLGSTAHLVFEALS